MTRSVSVLAALAAASAITACAGDTDPATNVTNVSAQLNAHGRTTGEPATWWWEYSTVQSNLGGPNDTEVCGAGTGPKESDNRCGPASWDNRGDLNLNVVVTGLTPNTTYYFRACGQKQSWGQGACGAVKSFKTLAGTSYSFAGALPRPGSAGPPDCQVGFGGGLDFDPSGYLYAIGGTACQQPPDLIWKLSPGGQAVLSWGSNIPIEDGRPFSPTSLATGSGSSVYVAESQVDRVQRFSSLGARLGKWGTSGSADGQFNVPADLATDSSGNVYVVEFNGNRVQKFTASGGFVTKWGSHGFEAGEFFFPSGIAIDRFDNVYVADGLNFRIQQFTTSGTFVKKWGSMGSADGQFGACECGGPLDVATDSAGNIYAADYENHRIQKFAPDGTFITKWGTRGNGPGQFEYPYKLTVDSTGNVYVIDTAHRAIQKFSPTR
jgi:hypothetical protein